MKKLKITCGFCAMICIVAWLDLAFCMRLLFCVVCHEIGHVLAILLCRGRISSVRLSAGGAIMETSLLGYGKELFCAAAGPLTGLILALAVLRVESKTAIISVILSAVNLLPLYPLDGGRMLRAVLSLCISEVLVEKVMRTVTVITCCLLMVLACWGAVFLQMGLWPIFAALVLLWRAGDRE